MTRTEVLQKAAECVSGKRTIDYGKPENNFIDIAVLWSWYLGRPVTGGDVAVMMGLLKVARIKGNTDSPAPDNFVDLAGYAACAGEIMTSRR